LGIVNRKLLNRFDIKQPVMFAAFNWQELIQKVEVSKTVFNEAMGFTGIVYIFASSQRLFSLSHLAVNIPV